MAKKILALVLTAALCWSLTACGDNAVCLTYQNKNF